MYTLHGYRFKKNWFDSFSRRQTKSKKNNMKHSRKESKPRGYSRGRNDNNLVRKGPIMIDDIVKEAATYSKSDMTIREMTYRTEPSNAASPIIKLKFKPLDNPGKILTVLAGILVIKQGISGNNITTGPLQYAYWRGCISGTFLNRFNIYAAAESTETINNLSTVEKNLVKFFAPNEVLRKQKYYMRTHMRKPNSVSTRQYVGAVQTLNDTLAQMPPTYDATQKLSGLDLMEIMASKAPQSHKDLMVEHGFDPQTATTEKFEELCERAENRDSKRKPKYDDMSEEDSGNERQEQKKNRKKPKYNRETRREFFCKEHGPNSTHDSKTCLVLQDPENRNSWKSKKDNKPYDKDKYKTDERSKYKKKQRELHVLQLETTKEKQSTKREKEKWIKLHKKLKEGHKEAESDEESRKSESSQRSYRYEKAKAKTERMNESRDFSENQSSSSSSSSDSDE